MSGSPMHDRLRRRIQSTVSVVLFFVGIILVILFFYLDRNDEVSSVIGSWGAIGIALSIGLMAGFCMLPIPSEFLLLMNFKVYGVWWGILVAWIGTMIGSVAIYFVTRHIGRPMLERFVPEDKFQQIERFVDSKRTTGLLIARLLPIPGFLVNYVAGLLKPIDVWTYMWTAAVTIIPYYVGTALLYLGINRRLTTVFFVGLLIVAVIWIISHRVNRNPDRPQAPQ